MLLLYFHYGCTVDDNEIKMGILYLCKNWRNDNTMRIKASVLLLYKGLPSSIHETKKHALCVNVNAYTAR